MASGGARVGFFLEGVLRKRFKKGLVMILNLVQGEEWERKDGEEQYEK